MDISQRPRYNPNYRAVVDMGSNGIRFSITDVSPHLARVLPTVFQDRAGISLYSAQYLSPTSARTPIPATTIASVTTALVRFKAICTDFGVRQPENVSIYATEATRTALNAAEFIGAIEDATDWTVTILSKEDEGRVGALGVASSSPSINGLVMDLGGGSTQLTWMAVGGDGDGNGNGKGDSKATTTTNSVSLPYGAAALTRRLAEADGNSSSSSSREQLHAELLAAFRSAYAALHVPTADIDDQAGLTLYLSGGGFRGWGYLLMARHPLQPYPIPTINGFRVTRAAFTDTVSVAKTAHKASSSASMASAQPVFRVSQRRADQVPAVAFLISALVEALPRIDAVQFCQGGVREGVLYGDLPAQIQTQDPLKVAALMPPASPFSSTSTPPSPSSLLTTILLSSLPANPSPPFPSAILSILSTHLHALSSYPKDLRPASALHTPLTGSLAAIHGLLHTDRAFLSLVLYARYSSCSLSPPRHDVDSNDDNKTNISNDGDDNNGSDLGGLDARLRTSLVQLVGAERAWWAAYVGRVARLVADVYPAGLSSGVGSPSSSSIHAPHEEEIPSPSPRVTFRASWIPVSHMQQKQKKKEKKNDSSDDEAMGIRLTILTPQSTSTTSSPSRNPFTTGDSFEKNFKNLEKLGKKKKGWIYVDVDGDANSVIAGHDGDEEDEKSKSRNKEERKKAAQGLLGFGYKIETVVEPASL
ncbi:MAG: hypothetical protein M1819_002420 [Sarea resinae]|nr:MAG: hypothetical protein M1819_002420 [Sarea resinae]